LGGKNVGDTETIEPKKKGYLYPGNEEVNHKGSTDDGRGREKKKNEVGSFGLAQILIQWR